MKVKALVLAWLLPAVLIAAKKDGKAQWEAGMDDDAGKAAATTVSDLPAADYGTQAQIYPKRDRLCTTSLNGTWRFKLVKGLMTPEELAGWEKPGYDVSGWDPIDVPGNWETQGFKSPQYGNQIDEMAGFYVRDFNWNYRWEGQRVILRFDGVLFGYEVWVNGEYVGRWGSAYNLAQWDVTDKLVKGRNVIAVKVLTRSHAWLFDTNDCWCIAGIQRDVELWTVPNDHVRDIVFRTLEINGNDAKVRVEVEAGVFDPAASKAATAYVSLVDEAGVHALDLELPLDDGEAEGEGVVSSAHLWSPESPYLYDLVVTLVDRDGAKLERIVEKQGLKSVEVEGTRILVNGRPVFLKGVAWSEIDPVEGRAIGRETRRRQMALMKKGGVNCIRTAHYPFGPDFLELADEMGFYVIDEIPFGSRGSMLLKNRAYLDELIVRTEATMRRDKNHASVVMWTFGNENPYTSNTKEVLAYARRKDPTRPRGLPQIGSSQAKETLYHPERDVDVVCPHYLSAENMKEYEAHAAKPLVQTEFAHACGNGFNDFENRYAIMCANKDVWAGGCIWAWIDQSLMHDEHNEAFEKELSLTRTQNQPDGTRNSDLPKDMRRDLPRDMQGNYTDRLHFIDSWGDRATDGIVYGEGTPKDGYWLVKALYGGKLPLARPKTPAPKVLGNAELQREIFRKLAKEDGTNLLLRVGRKAGMDMIIQTMGSQKPYRHDVYVLVPEILDFAKTDDSATWRLKWILSGDETRYIEGTVKCEVEEDAKIAVEYELTASENCRKTDKFVELGLTWCANLSVRVDWVGDGALTSVPGKSRMNVFGTWSMHKDDYRFPGNRSQVKWAAAGNNRTALVQVHESQTGNVSFENIAGAIYFTENIAVAGYGGKSSGPAGLSRTGAAEIFKAGAVKGAFKTYLGAMDENRNDIVPDMTFTHHYGF
ncbi:MAG: hypothetical protein II909_01430 [Kiritimatiellae bacterium]|nr:hypothetical protein [Kiritimatiellia bacterium]